MNKNRPSAVIIDAIRTPIGKYGGMLKDVRPDDLMALVLQALLKRNSAVPASEIDDVLIGNANQAGEDNRNVARMAVLLAGLPVEIPGGTVNRLCGSGLMAVNQAAQAIMAGEGDIYLAGGVESMTRAPYVMAKPDNAFPRGDTKLYDSTLGWRFTNPTLAEKYYPYSMGETAENLAEKYAISREEQDQFAYESQMRTKTAQEAGKFIPEILPVPIKQGKSGETLFQTDEFPRPETTLADLARLKPAFRAGGSVTAGNASGINDGAAAVLITSEKMAEKLGLTPMARIVSTAVAGVDPAFMGLGPVPATWKALLRAELEISDIGLAELNEAFAVQSLACIQELGLHPGIVNVNGGAIALGHPLGCSGARIMSTLLHELKRRPHVQYGLAAMCIGVGQGIATIIENMAIL